MTRGEMLDYVASMFQALADETGIPLTDEPAGLAYQLDAAQDELGDDTENKTAARALIEFHALRKFRAGAAARPDFDATAIKRAKRSQIYEQIDALITDAGRRCAAAGHPTEAATGYGITAINLQIIEPDPLEALL